MSVQDRLRATATSPEAGILRKGRGSSPPPPPSPHLRPARCSAPLSLTGSVQCAAVPARPGSVEGALWVGCLWASSVGRVASGRHQSEIYVAGCGALMARWRVGPCLLARLRSARPSVNRPPSAVTQGLSRYIAKPTDMSVRRLARLASQLNLPGEKE